MFSFAIDYYLMVVIAACGVLQIAASVGRLDALLLFKSPLMARSLGIVLAVVGPVLFFATAERNINDYEGGLDGNFQGLFFLLGTITALVLTFAATSFVNRSMDHPTQIENGIESLKRTNYARALANNTRFLRKHRRMWRTWTRSYFFG
ncbi:MAG: hypothetical protein F4Y50_09115 [Dehalococcoidia bacterium]|nr:hypothetical protein [Dehalococcoidia bacterium]